MNIIKTRYPELSYTKVSNNDWRFVYTKSGETPAIVGPIYKSRNELLADLRYFHAERFESKYQSVNADGFTHRED